MGALVFDLLWTGGAIFGILIQVRAILVRRHLIDTAEMVAAGPPLLLQLRNDLLLYRIRLGLICNNFVLGILALSQVVGIVHFPVVAYSLYATLTISANEFTLVILAWRDQHLLSRRPGR